MIESCLIGKGAYGQVWKITGTKAPFVVKIGDILEIAHEHKMHESIYKDVSPACKKYFVKPLKRNMSKLQQYLPEMNDRQYAYAMEHVVGLTLRNYLQMASASDVKFVLDQVHAAFKCMWSHGYIHGDAHLDNIIVTNIDHLIRGGKKRNAKPKIKIIDFGFATKVSTPAKSLKTVGDLRTWFKKEWQKILKRMRLNVANPNFSFFNYNAVPFFCKRDLEVMKDMKQVHRLNSASVIRR